MSVTEEHGTVGLDKVQESAALYVSDVRAGGAFDRIRHTSDRPKRSDRGADSTRHDGLRALEPGEIGSGRAGHLSPRISATRPAKYVSTARAPARLIAVSCSIAAASASTHPFCAAAWTIAYSPLTW